METEVEVEVKGPKGAARCQAAAKLLILAFLILSSLYPPPISDNTKGSIPMGRCLFCATYTGPMAYE